MFLDLPYFHWYQVCEVWLNIHQVVVVPRWLYGHAWTLRWRHAPTKLYAHCSKWPNILYNHYTHHLFSFHKCLNKRFSCILLFPCIWQKREMFKYPPCWIHSISHASLLRPSPPHSFCPKTHQKFHGISMKCNIAPHTHFSLKLPNTPSTDFQPWTTLYLTPYTLYKILMPWFHTDTPLKREKLNLHIEAPKHFFHLEALLSSFLLLYSSHLKTIEYCWWCFWSCEQAQEAVDLLN